jgi:hypothetical protein
MGTTRGERAADLRSKLDAIAEELADMGYSELREAAETGRAEAAARERRLGQARRSVLKASALLRGAANDDYGN